MIRGTFFAVTVICCNYIGFLYIGVPLYRRFSIAHIRVVANIGDGLEPEICVL